MRLSLEAIQEFQEIYLKHFGTPISDDEANEYGLELEHFLVLIYRPVPKRHAWMVQRQEPMYEIL